MPFSHSSLLICAIFEEKLQQSTQLGIDICENKRVRIDPTNGIFEYQP
jgi:hypothetical protein